MRALALRLGHPELGRLTVHVTGTKGKGSVSALVAAGLAAAGLRTGVYTSPHVERLNERILLPRAGEARPEPIADEPFAAALERVLAAHDGLTADDPATGSATSWFDLVSLASFHAFRTAGLDAQVIEVGLGGRLDSTNIVAPDVCVLTNVDLEHTAILGSTRAAIAREKSGIFKPGAPAVTSLAADDEAGAVAHERAAALGIPLTVVAPTPGEPILSRNLRLARAALDSLGALGRAGADGRRLSGQILSDALATGTALPGRMELRYRGRKPVLFDGAHVPSSLELVLDEALHDPRFTGRGATVIAVHTEKNLSQLLAPLARLAGPVLCTTLPTGVHRTADEVAAAARGLGLTAEVHPDPGAALERAVELADWVLVTGSLYLVGALRAATEVAR